MTNDPRKRARLELGKRIKEAREARGISQAQLGTYAVPPVTAQSVLKWEQGRSAPDARTLDAIAQLTGKTIKWFLYGVENESGANQGDFGSQVGRVIPMFVFNEITSHISVDMAGAKGKIRTNFPCSANSFQTFAEDDANHPDIQVGDSVVIDMDRTPKPGKFALVMHEGAPVIGRYRPRKTHIEIAPLNEDWPPVEVAPEDVIGAVTEIARPHG